MIQVRFHTPADDGCWDRFVEAHPLGSPLHTTAWMRSVEQAFSYRPCYLLAEQDGRLAGVLPLFEVRNPLMGRVLLSTPFAVYGGILAESPEAKTALAGRAADYARERNVQYLELRNAYDEQCTGFERLSRYVTFTQEIGPDEESILQSIPRKTRAAVRKGIGFDLKSRQTNELKRFERLYDNSLRRLGTPSFPTRFFQALQANFGAGAGIHEVLYGDAVAGAFFTFYFRDRVLPYYGASDPAYNAYQVNNFMYFDLMAWAGKNGFRTFDFGRSKKHGSGSYDFKSRWGMVERELPYEMLLVRRKELPNFSPTNPKFQLAIRVWQKLPLPLTKAIGPFFVRLVP